MCVCVFLRFIYLLCIQCCGYIYTCIPKEGTRSYYDGFEPPCGCWELYSGPMEEHPVLLTNEPSLQPLNMCLSFIFYNVSICVYVYRGQTGGSPGAGVVGGCESPDTGVGNRTQVLWKSNVCSQPLDHLSSLLLIFLSINLGMYKLGHMVTMFNFLFLKYY